MTDSLFIGRFFGFAQSVLIVAAVGDGMSHTTGVAGRFFKAMGSASINVLAIAQVHENVSQMCLFVNCETWLVDLPR